MRRFWTQATTGAVDGGFTVLLDGRPIRLPGGSPLAVPMPDLAAAIAAEWDAASPEFTPDDLTLTQLAGSALERVTPDPTPIRHNLLAYGGADLLCYRADRPAALVVLQAEAWQPWLDWATETWSARLIATTGISAVIQSDAALAGLHHALAAMDCWELAGLGVLVPTLGSLVLGLAVARGALAPAEAHRLSILDETWQERALRNQGLEIDAEILTRRAAVAAEIASAAQFIKLTRS